MRLLGILVVALAASASAFVEVQRGYHDEIGIPTAERIRKLEEFNAERNRIVGGVIAPANAHPHFAGLLISFFNTVGNSVCGSSLLSATRLVTAAHCWFDGNRQASQFVVILGTTSLYSGGIRITTNQVYTHPQWQPSTLNNDVAVIYLPSRVPFTGSIQPIALPNADDLNNEFIGIWATAAGYGKTSDTQQGASTIVSEVTVQVITVNQCQRVYGSPWVQQSTLCTNGAGGVGVCGGDSGGPLVTNVNGRRVLIGISSFVPRAGCQLGHPSAFARVTSFYNFINGHL